MTCQKRLRRTIEVSTARMNRRSMKGPADRQRRSHALASTSSMLVRTVALCGKGLVESPRLADASGPRSITRDSLEGPSRADQRGGAIGDDRRIDLARMPQREDPRSADPGILPGRLHSGEGCRERTGT